MTDTVGMKISIPAIPIRLPPSVQLPVPRWMEADRTTYYMRIDQVSFYLLQDKEKSQKQNCFYRTYHKDQKNATQHPIIPPNSGINAVNEIRTPTSIAYGKCRIVMDTKNILPRITASIHCPVIKLEKILFARFHTCARYLTGFSGNIAYIAFFICCRSFSFCKRRSRRIQSQWIHSLQ